MANYIGNQPLNGEFKVLDSIESQFNNSSTSFGLKYNTASQTVGDAAQLIVSLNGVIQQPLTSYTLSGVTNIVFASPPSSGDTCFIILLGGVGGTVTPSDNSVTTEKLTNSSVTSAKIVNNTITADDMDSSDSYSFAGVNVGTTFVTDTVNDRIGVGTTNPTYPLDVEDDGAGFIKGSFVSTGSSHSSITFDNTGSAAASVRVGSNNDDFYVRTSGSEKLRVTSAGNVGIGETSPAYPLDINGGTENVVVRISSTDADALMVFEDNSTTDRVLLGAQGEDFLLRTDLGKFTFRVNNNATDGMVILNNGNVGIGKTSPPYALHVERTPSASGFDGISLEDTTTVVGLFKTGSSYSFGSVGSNQSWIYSNTSDLNITSDGSGIIKFQGENGSERMRIDSSGNLLVGTTNSTPHNLTSGGGLSVRGPINLFSIARQDNEVMIVNRTGTDGDHALFRKNGTTVGSIGNASSLNIIYLAGQDSGIKILRPGTGIDGLLPCDNTGSNRDALMDLGSSGVRFKDLYMSGGVYLGGSTSSNFLDDYEEGTFTPTFVGSTGGTVTLGSAFDKYAYTKIGRIVTITGRVDVSGTPSLSGNLLLQGLPFTSGNLTDQAGYTVQYGFITIGASNTGNPIVIELQEGTTEAVLRLEDWTSAAGVLVNNSRIQMSITYFTS